MLSWTFLAAAVLLTLVPPALPARFRVRVDDSEVRTGEFDTVSYILKLIDRAR
jgi:hypothetical protein